jgi:hypothetical protein
MIKRIINPSKILNKFIQKLKIIMTTIERREYLLRNALVSNKRLISDSQPHGNELIVSLTTYSKRIHDVHLVIESIGLQTLKPDRIILWLDEDEFSIEMVPLLLLKQLNRGLEIEFCTNYKSYKKIIPTMKKYPYADVITIDDDILYPHDMIETLISEAKLYPHHIIGQRAHKIKLNKDNKLEPYAQWEHETNDEMTGPLVFITSGAGTLFPKGCFNDEVLNSKVFLTICPTADDVWLKAMALLSETKEKKINDHRPYWSRYLLLDDSQDIGLFNFNVGYGHNDKLIAKVFNKYNLHSKIQH